MCWTARTPPGLRPRTGRRRTCAGHPVRPVRIRRKRGSILPRLLLSPLLPARPPGRRQTEDVDIGLRRLGTVTTPGTVTTLDTVRGGQEVANVGLRPPSLLRQHAHQGSGLPADGALLEQLLQQTFSRFSAAKTALPPFPYPGQGPAAATAPAPAAVAQLPKGLTPEEERAVMLMRAAPLVAPPSITRMLTPPHRGTLPRSPSRSAQPQATDDEEVLSEHSGLEVHAQDDGLLDRDIEMQVEEPIPAPTPPPRPVPVQPALDTVSLGDPDDLPGDVNAWRATWAGEKFKFRVPARIQETRRQIV